MLVSHKGTVIPTTGPLTTYLQAANCLNLTKTVKYGCTETAFVAVTLTITDFRHFLYLLVGVSMASENNLNLSYWVTKSIHL